MIHRSILFPSYFAFLDNICGVNIGTKLAVSIVDEVVDNCVSVCLMHFNTTFPAEI